MGSQHLNLKWRNHNSNLLTVFAQLLASESLADVTLVCDGASIRAHKIILSACSPFFHTIFAQHPCQHPIIILKDVAYSDLKVLIDFMYSGEVNIAQEFLPSFLQAAESLKIKGLSDNESSNCSSSAKRNVQPDSQSRSSPAGRCKRRRHSRNMSEEKSDDESSTLDVPDDARKEKSVRPSYDMLNAGATNRFSSPMERFQHAYNWGMSTESSKYVEVNLQDDDTNTTGRSVCLGQDDSTTDPVGADSDSPQEMKPSKIHSSLPPDFGSLRQLQRVTGLISTVTRKYSPNRGHDPANPNTGGENDNGIVQSDGTLDAPPPEIKCTKVHPSLPPDFESLRQLQRVTGLMSTVTRDFSPNHDSANINAARENDTGITQPDSAMDVTPPVEIGHVLTKLPRHKKKDCIVCGNRQAGQRRRSRQWCPGCNVGVHVHCFAKLEHYRRTNKRTPRPEISSEIVQVKVETFSESNVESNVESDGEYTGSALAEMEPLPNEVG